MHCFQFYFYGIDADRNGLKNKFGLELQIEWMTCSSQNVKYREPDNNQDEKWLYKYCTSI